MLPDPATHYFGWAFFRTESSWKIPPGMTSQYGSGYNSSLFFSDSIPLIALPLRLLDFLLPQHFQYLGFWIFLSFLGQGYFSLRLARLTIHRQSGRLMFVALCLLSPIFLYRLVHEGQGHIHLASHFLILLALCLYFERPPTSGLWPLAFSIALLVQAYLAVMVLLVFFGSVIDQYRTAIFSRNTTGWSNMRSILLPILKMAIVLTLTGWAVGALSANRSSFASEGFGRYKADLLSMIDPNPQSTRWNSDWSVLLPNIPNQVGSEEGFAYLGLGVIVLIVAAIVRRPELLVRNPTQGRLNMGSGLIFIALSSFIFGVSNKISVAGISFPTIPLGEQLEQTASYFRASGRFVWIPVYLLLLWAASQVSSGSGPVQKWRLLGCTFIVCLQVADIAPTLSKVRSRFEDVSTVQSQQASEWVNVAETASLQRILETSGRTCLQVVPGGFSYGWIDFSRLAYELGMSTNQGYFSRVNDNRFRTAESNIISQIRSGRLKQNCVYVLTPSAPMNLRIEAEALFLKKATLVGNSLVLVEPKEEKGHDVKK